MSDFASVLNQIKEQSIEYVNLYRTRFLGHKFVSCGGPE